jgi:general secretion pathway protein G
MRKPSTWLVVTIILGVVGIVLSALPWRRHRGPSAVITTRMHLLQVAEGTRSYQLHYGFWPTGLADLYPAQNSNHIAFLPSGQWTTNDAWGRPLIYTPFDGVLGHGTVVSLGRDGTRGGTGEDADIEQGFQ